MSHVIDSPELLFSGACTCRSGSDHFTSNVHNTGATLAQTKFIEFLPLTEFFLTCFHSSRQASRTRCPLWRIRRPSTSGQGSVSSLSSAHSSSMPLSIMRRGGMDVWMSFDMLKIKNLMWKTSVWFLNQHQGKSIW